MLTEPLYLQDPYIREFDAEVMDTDDHGIYLDRSSFYPGGGGQPCDTGWILGDKKYRVVRMERDMLHIIEGEKPKIGTRVRGFIDWERRYRIMRLHTALHVISGVTYRRYGRDIITGNQIYEDKARLDLSLENLTRELVEDIIEESNRVIEKGYEVRWYYISREEFEERPELMRVDPRLYDRYERIRVVEIVGFDLQADGGTHVRNLREVGKIKMERYKSKGKNKKRIYITLV